MVKIQWGRTRSPPRKVSTNSKQPNGKTFEDEQIRVNNRHGAAVADGRHHAENPTERKSHAKEDNVKQGIVPDCVENVTVTNVAVMKSIGQFSSVFNTTVPYSKLVNIPSISDPKHMENNLIKSPTVHKVSKGLGNSWIIRSIHKLVRDQAPTMCFLMETRLDKESFDNQCSDSPFQNKFIVRKPNSSGGLALLWKT